MVKHLQYIQVHIVSGLKYGTTLAKIKGIECKSFYTVLVHQTIGVTTLCSMCYGVIGLVPQTLTNMFTE